MGFRKFQAEKIFDGKRFCEPGMVLITDEKGGILDLVDSADAGEDIRLLPGIISPGFINCHCHLELSHMKRRIPEHTGLVDFVLKVVTERHHPEEEILQAISDAEDEMLQNGIVAVGDICNNNLTIPQKQKRRIAYFNFIEASGWIPAIAAGRLDRAKALLAEYDVLRYPGSKFNASIVPHAPYSVSGELWKGIEPYFRDKVVSIHNQETASEDEFFIQGTGEFNRMYQLMNIENSHHEPTRQTSLRSYYNQLLSADRVILVHNSFTGKADVEFALANQRSEGQLFFCLCVNANLYIENTLPAIGIFRDAGAQLVLGTDSLASNWSLDIAAEMRTLRQRFPEISLEEMLGWATLNGAKALDMDDRAGSFEKGKAPGIVRFDENLTFIERL
ncbi:MAG TPA: amidohydrolase family protein [Chitinophagaceae bacterium]